MRLVSNIIPLEATSFLGLIFIPIGFIFCSFNLYLSDLFDFIVVDRKRHTFNVMIVEIRFGLSSIIWLLEANQSENESITIWTSSNTNTFYFTISFEEITYFLLFPRIWEVFDIKITSSFAGFKAKSITKFFLLTKFFLQSRFDNKFQTISHIMTIQFLDSIFSTFWSIFFVDTFWIIIADKTELTKFVRL